MGSGLCCIQTNLVHLNNSKLVSLRLARTMQELTDFNFEVRYTPGHLNSAVDLLSRLGTLPYLPEEEEDRLLDGLVLDGLPVAGGGNSLFICLHRRLAKVSAIDVPSTVLQLCQQLVDELQHNSEKCKIILDKQNRQQLKLMRFNGQLPSLDLLLAVSFIYKVRVFVYFYPGQPVVYQYEHYDSVVHLQCISGIHFNPLVELLGYDSSV